MTIDRRALKSVWWDAKEKARQAARAAAAEAAAVACLPIEALRCELVWLENSDARLGWAGQERLSTLRRELAQRAA